MITLTRLNGAAFALNDRLVERIEANPDTVVVLTDGKKFIVAESVDDVVEQIRQARADVAVRSSMIEVIDDPGPDLRLVSDDGDDPPDGDVSDDFIANEFKANEFNAKEGGTWIP